MYAHRNKPTAWADSTDSNSRSRAWISATTTTSFAFKLSQKSVVLQQFAQAQYNCNTSFLQLLQVACKFSASCRKLVLKRCIAGVCTSAIQMQCKKKFSYCTCIVVALHLWDCFRPNGGRSGTGDSGVDCKLGVTHCYA